tara:strand:- start:55 stop:282 length:228 start_codon:yes stop_codon:yes gene_type:complete
MRLLISKLFRQYKKDILPSTCYAYQHVPYSLSEICDCQKFCKFPPKGNEPLEVVPYIPIKEESKPDYQLYDKKNF